MISFVLYLVIVVITTPSLRPADAIRISTTLNWWVIGGASIGVGAQTFLVTYAKEKGCPVAHGMTSSGTTGLFSGLSSFLSFLSLIPLGCCGTWLYILSFLPGLLGTGASAFFIAYAIQLEVAGLLLMVASVLYTYFSIRRALPLSGQSN
jgi:hypothetical protein